MKDKIIKHLVYKCIKPFDNIELNSEWDLEITLNRYNEKREKETVYIPKSYLNRFKAFYKKGV